MDKPSPDSCKKTITITLLQLVGMIDQQIALDLTFYMLVSMVGKNCSHTYRYMACNMKVTRHVKKMNNIHTILQNSLKVPKAGHNFEKEQSNSFHLQHIHLILYIFASIALDLFLFETYFLL